MKLALECSTNLLDMVQPFADLDFVLSYKFAEDPEYRNYYKNSQRFKILDNSVNEVGKPDSLSTLVDICNDLKPDAVIAPDVLGDYNSTVRNYLECIKAFSESSTKVIGVLQGSNFEELKEGLEIYQGVVAVPYDILSQKSDPPWLMALRRALVVNSLCISKPVHLLGFNGAEEFEYYRNSIHVKSIDTGAPILLGLQNKDILDRIESKSKPTLVVMDELSQSIDQKKWGAVCRNIALLRKLMGYIPE